ncbi:hypothetical protein IMG5_128690, partial [Ichthyophthirius multifiliis]
GLVYSKQCLKKPSEQYINSKKVDVNWPKNSKSNTLFLDLDETLIYIINPKEKPNHIITVRGEGNIELK